MIIEDTTLVGELVAPFTATDQDDGPGGMVSYNISKGNEEQFFSVSMSGDLRVASSPLLPGTYTLTVCAYDHGTPPLSTCSVIKIAVHSTGGVDCSKPEYGEREGGGRREGEEGGGGGDGNKMRGRGTRDIKAWGAGWERETE